MKWVPVSYCQFCIKNNCTNAGRLFCYLKHHSDGITDKSILLKAGRYFKKSDRTIRRWLNQAMIYNWISKHEDMLFIRGWQYLFDTLDFPKKACFQFRKSDLKNFKTFCYAAVISYMAKRTQEKELERLQDSNHSKGRSNQAPAWVPMSSSAIAKTLNVSQKTAQTFRQNVVDAGYIKKKLNLKPFHIKITDLNHFRKFSDCDKHLVVRDREVYEQLPDLVLTDSKNIHSPKRFFLKQKYSHPESYSMYVKSVQRL